MQIEGITGPDKLQKIWHTTRMSPDWADGRFNGDRFMGLMDHIWGDKKVEPASSKRIVEKGLEAYFNKALDDIFQKGSNTINEAFGLSEKNFIDLERGISDLHTRSFNARDMIKKLAPSKKERYVCCAGFFVGAMVNEINLTYLDGLPDLFDVDMNTFFAKKIKIGACLKDAKDILDFIKCMRRYETRDDKDRKSFACGFILGLKITSEMK